MANFIGIILCAFLLILLLLKRKTSKEDHYLTIWLGVVLFHQVAYSIEKSEWIVEYPNLLGISFSLPALHGILLFFYVSASLNAKLGKKNVAALHSSLYTDRVGHSLLCASGGG